MKTLTGESVTDILRSIIGDSDYNWLTYNIYSKRVLEVKMVKSGEKFSWMIRYVISRDHRKIMPSVYVTRTENMTRTHLLRVLRVEK